MFRLCSKIEVGGKKFEGVNSVSIKRSIYDLASTATIKVPVTAVLKSKDETKQVETAKAIKVGDKVKIELGYNDSYKVEFVGYVKAINLRTPLEIECEDEYYITRNRNVTLQGKTTLKDIIAECGLSARYLEELTLANFEADNRSVSWVLKELKTKYGLCIYFDLKGKLYAHAPSKVVGDAVKYQLRKNVISDDDLTYQRADDVKVSIKALCVYEDGTEVQATAGVEGGEQKTLHFYNVENEKELATLANIELERLSYDGYRGKITTFLQPYSQPTMVAEIVDEIYSERDGRYLIESVDTTFSRSGARRQIEIGRKCEVAQS